MKYSNIFLIYLFIFLILVNLGLKIFGYWSTLLYFSLVLLAYYVISRSTQKGSSDICNLWLSKPESIFSDVIEENTLKSNDEMTICLMCNDFACERHDPELAIYLQPWKHLLIDPEVNTKLEQLFEFLLKKYTETWLDDVSYNKEEILFQLKSLIRIVASSLLLRLYRKFNFSDFLLGKFPKYLMHHLEMYIYGKRKAKSGRFLEESVLHQYSSLIHPALISAENERKYLKSIADLIIYSSLPPKYTRCDVSKAVLNEFISCCLLSPLVEIFTDPDKINIFFISLLNNGDNYSQARHISKMSLKENRSKVEFLMHFKIFNYESDKNHLGVKLKTILEDQHLLFLFTQYSKEEYFLNYLQFVMHMNSFFNQIINPDLSDSQQEELHKKLSNIYNMYFVKSSKDYIYFDQKISCGFKEIVQSNYTQLVYFRNSRSLYDAYEFVNYKLEYYCHKFFLTDVYLKLICGQRSLSFNLNSSEVSQENDNHKIDKSKQLLERDNFLSEKLSENPKDLSKWKVSIPRVVSQLDSVGRETHFFEINVVKVEDEEEVLEECTIHRLIGEFYTLESRLKEFHGDELENINLPTRKLYLRPSRNFLESQQVEFEYFLQQLLANDYLKRSELICSFLSCSDWHNNLLENFNLTKMIRNVPSKFSKERGQHLESFLKHFVESSEKSDNWVANSGEEELLGSRSRRRGVNSLLTISPPKLTSTATDRTTAHIEYLYDHLLLMLIRLYNLSNFIVQFLLLLRPLIRQTFQHLCDYFLCKKAKHMLKPNKLVELLHYLTESLNNTKGDRHTFPLNMSRNQRSELALKLITGIIPKWLVTHLTDYSKHEEVVFLLFSLLQHRLLNKQLLYLILNILVAELFPDVLLNTVEHTGS